jgi:Mor family transcriptional regulator
VILEAVNEKDSAAVVARIMGLYGNMQLYIPMERYAFKKTIALEIYSRFGPGISMNDLAREYGVSADHAYSLWKQGRAEKLKPSMPFLPFLELSGKE